MKPAIFLDRDGTLIEQVHHLRKVEDVSVYSFAADALRRFDAMGFLCVVVTNQSVIGRGLLDENGLQAIHTEMLRQLGDCANLIQSIYFCPLVPGIKDRTLVENEMRKPGAGMLMAAAQKHGIALEESWMIGDAISDVLAGKNAGCRGSVLVRTGNGALLQPEHKTQVDHVANDLMDAAHMIDRIVRREKGSGTKNAKHPAGRSGF